MIQLQQNDFNPDYLLAVSTNQPLIKIVNMSLSLSARRFANGIFVSKRIFFRQQSSTTTSENANDDFNDALTREFRQKTNREMAAILNRFTKFPKDEFLKYVDEFMSPLSEKELQLDEKLAKFLKHYSTKNTLMDSHSATPTLKKIVHSGESTKKFPYLISSTNDQPYTKQELFARQMKHALSTAKLGSDIKNVYFPHQDVFNPPSTEDISIKKLFAAGVHLGQSVSLWRSSTQPYIYGEYKGIHIIDLSKTLSHLKRAVKVIEGVTEKGGIILFLGTRDGQKRVLQHAAERVNGYYVSSRWIPGTLTNPTEISSGLERHEVDILGNPTGRELTIDESVSIIKPDLLIVLNPTENRNALLEAMKTRVPTIGIVDTDSEPSLLTYPIPGNDDSLRSTSLLVSILAKAGQRGLEARMNKVAA